ncbi:MAG: ATPase, T2SS/T4P/T4SS family [Candidatus Omnitrophica bacterium]|nr:ATPase, T2SS/T4P/T4SS family [Candidatus Omnitrophota bacterium]
MLNISASSKKEKIGQELVRAGIITAKQLKFAIKEQRRLKGEDRERLGEVLLRAGFIGEKTLTGFLEKYLGIPYAELRSGKNIDPLVVKLIPEQMARNIKALAIGMNKDNNKLMVAMSNPMDIVALDTLRLKTGYEIDRYFSHTQEINAAIDKYYEEYALKESVRDYINIRESEIIERREKDRRKSPAQPEKNIAELEEDADKTPVIEFVEHLLTNAMRSRASDIHIEPRENDLCIRYRVDGFLNKSFPPPKEMQGAIIARLKLLGDMNIAEQRLPQDGRFKFKFEERDIDVRVASAPTAYGEKLVMRLLDSMGLVVDMVELGMPQKNVEQFKSILKQPYGMILVTGPTGSGKTTTLYSALSYINTPEKNIVTIEDPIEYLIDGINQIQTKYQIGLTFASGLRAVLRQDPDIIMIGEIRDLETLENAVKASLTGHLVLSTIHTNDAASVVTRLMHMGLEPYLIPSCLSLVIAQRLVRKICPDCREKIDVPQEALSELKKRTGLDLSEIKFYRGKGCNKCGSAGYRGRCGLYEFLPISKKIKQMIAAGVSDADIKMAAQAEGMKDIFQAGIEKINEGVTSLEEVLRVTVLEKSV